MAAERWRNSGQRSGAGIVHCSQIDGVLRSGEYALQHGLEEAQWQAFIVRVEGGRIVFGAELDGRLVLRVILELLAQVAIHAQVVEEVIALENAMLLDHPVILGTDERLEDGCGNVRVVVAA